MHIVFGIPFGAVLAPHTQSHNPVCDFPFPNSAKKGKEPELGL